MLYCFLEFCVSVVYFLCSDVRFSHLNKSLLTYLLTYLLTLLFSRAVTHSDAPGDVILIIFRDPSKTFPYFLPTTLAAK